jgi:hypothetical protein
MPLSHGLALWLSPAALQATPAQGQRDYSPVVTSLTFTTVAPGGYGTLTATLNLKPKHLSRPELQLFSRIALMGQGERAFLGEISEIAISGSSGEETVQISALGSGNCLRDDSSNFAYTARTAKQIIVDQFGYSRNLFGYPVSLADTSQILPDDPATSFTLSYANRSIEEICSDLSILLGAYTWAVWDSPTERDAAGFPLSRLNMHQKDITTSTYMASIQQGDVSEYSISQSADRAYNGIAIWYHDPNSGPPAAVIANDSRLAGGGGIGTAPYRRRKFTRDLSGNSAASSTNAQALANALLSQYQNGGNKVEVTLSSVRDNNANPIALWRVRADGNVYIPEMSGRGVTAPTAALATVNQFYIIQTEYSESSEGVKLHLTCDNLSNVGDILVARLQYMAERMARTGGKVTELVQSLGAQVKGWANCTSVASAGAQVFALGGTFFRPVLYQAPTSISWSAAAFQTNNAGSPGTNNLTAYGFHAFVSSIAGGAVTYGGNFLTNGNCVYLTDARRGLFDSHCDWCGEWARNRALKTDVIVWPDAPGGAAMSVLCPHCGASESLNLDLDLADEEHRIGNAEHRAEQARSIRGMMRHAHVGLHHLVRDCNCRSRTHQAPAQKQGQKQAPRRAAAVKPGVTSAPSAPVAASPAAGRRPASPAPTRRSSRARTAPTTA